MWNVLVHTDVSTVDRGDKIAWVNLHAHVDTVNIKATRALSDTIWTEASTITLYKNPALTGS